MRLNPKSSLLLAVCAAMLSGVILLSFSKKPSDASAVMSINPDWLELPGVPKGELMDIHTHESQFGYQFTRDWTYSWDNDARLSRWVAYPLFSYAFGGNLQRTNEWGYDPSLPRKSQPNLYRSFRPQEYSRGHQIPSGDRIRSREVNAKTFYFTNMTPQLDEFNRGIWNNVEIKVRSWARRCDTLYVVTGCVTDGSRKKAYDSDGKEVTVPTAYYKAVLAYSKKPYGTDDFRGHDGYLGAAIWLDHKEYSGETVRKDMWISIDELERRTGLDFFIALPDKVGAKDARTIEAEKPGSVSWWWK